MLVSRGVLILPDQASSCGDSMEHGKGGTGGGGNVNNIPIDVVVIRCSPTGTGASPSLAFLKIYDSE